jgi:hypothetical protein
MSKVTITSKIRFLAGLAPVILLIVIPIIALEFWAFGSLPSSIKENQLAAVRYAEGLDSSLYKMEWGKTQPDGPEIVIDQQRRFADLLDYAARHLYTSEQRDSIQALAAAAKPTLDAFRHSDPHDEAVNKKMRDLHTLVTNLQNADEAALDQFSESTKAEARQFVIMALIAGLLLPMVCFIVIWRLTSGLRTDLREIRAQLERGSEPGAARNAAFESINLTVTRMGYPKPNPMLSQD